MKAFLLLAMTVGLVGCDKHNAERYQLTSSADGNVYRLDKKTGEVGLVRPDGVHIVGSQDPLSVLQAAAKNEIARRQRVYAFLSTSKPAQEVRARLAGGRIGNEEARTILESLIPRELGTLPRGAEKEDWEARANGAAMIANSTAASRRMSRAHPRHRRSVSSELTNPDGVGLAGGPSGS